MAHTMGHMEKDFDKWNGLKKHIELRRSVFCNTRDIWWCSIGANVGAEASGKNELFERPVLILKVYSTESVLVAPLTSKQREGPYHARITYAGREGWAILSHAKTISPKRLQRKLSKIDKTQHAVVLKALITLVETPRSRKQNQSAPVSRGLGAVRPDGTSVSNGALKSSDQVDKTL